MGAKSSAQTRVRRLVTLIGISLLLAMSAYGPGNVASALGFRNAPPPPPESVGYLPSAVPARIQAPTARVVGLQKAVVNQVLRLADGTNSVPTTYLRVSRIELDDVEISHDRDDHKFVITNPNGSDLSKAAIAGNDQGSIVDLWLDVKSLELCVTPETLYSVVIGYAGVFGGRLDSLLAAIADVFAQFKDRPLGKFGPCLPLTSLIPVLGVLIDYGVPLPNTIPAANLDIYAIGLNVTTDPGKPAVTAPVAGVRVETK
ncbi:hypothetical protein [Antrihabitans spumae]